jgi:AbrB family looped-hinge helix DNA binding protein
MKSTISAKGQITVPVEVRNQLGLLPGTPVEFEIRAGEAVLRKSVKAGHPVDRVFGILGLEGSVDELLDEMRGARPARR